MDLMRNNLDKSLSIPLNALNPKLLRNIHKHQFGRIIRLHFSKTVWKKLKPGKVKFLLRVDDFPRLDLSFKDFRPFSNLMKEHEIPYVLGITPFLNFDNKPRDVTSEELNYLKSAINEGVSLSLHGFTHKKSMHSSFNSKLNEYKEEELENYIFKTQQWFYDRELPFPESFIPPFNSMIFSVSIILQRYFSVLFGGPFTLSTMQALGIGEKIGEAIYLPSYFPFYGRSNYISKNISKLIWERDVIIPVTIHWAWEADDEFHSLRYFLSKYKDSIVSFDIAKKWWRPHCV